MTLKCVRRRNFPTFPLQSGVQRRTTTKGKTSTAHQGLCFSSTTLSITLQHRPELCSRATASNNIITSFFEAIEISLVSHVVLLVSFQLKLLQTALYKQAVRTAPLLLFSKQWCQRAWAGRMRKVCLPNVFCLCQRKLRPHLATFCVSEQQQLYGRNAFHISSKNIYTYLKTRIVWWKTFFWGHDL